MWLILVSSKHALILQMGKLWPLCVDICKKIICILCGTQSFRKQNTGMLFGEKLVDCIFNTIAKEKDIKS